MVPVAQEPTANTVRLPYSFSRRFSLVAWCEAAGAERVFYAEANRRGRI